MLEPTVIVFYVDKPAISSRFYQDLLGIQPKEHSSTYTSFKLSNGMVIGLKDKYAQQLNITGNGGCELAFTAGNHKQVDELFLAWQQKGINVIEPPTMVIFGYTFTAIDPDGNRLRVVSLGE